MEIKIIAKKRLGKAENNMVKFIYFLRDVDPNPIRQLGAYYQYVYLSEEALEHESVIAGFEKELIKSIGNKFLKMYFPD